MSLIQLGHAPETFHFYIAPLRQQRRVSLFDKPSPRQFPIIMVEARIAQN